MGVRSLGELQPRIGARVYVDETALVVGDVDIGADSSIWPMCVVRGDVHQVRIGARSNIQDGCVLHVSHASSYRPGGAPLHIGDAVTVGHKVLLHGCTVEDGCFIGMGAVVMDGAVLGAGLLLGAASLVPGGKELEGGYLYLGSPVRRVRALTESERTYLTYSADHYVRVKDRYLAELG